MICFVMFWWGREEAGRRWMMIVRSGQSIARCRISANGKRGGGVFCGGAGGRVRWDARSPWERRLLWRRAQHFGLRAACCRFWIRSLLRAGTDGSQSVRWAITSSSPAAGCHDRKRQQGCTQSKVLRTPPHCIQLMNNGQWNKKSRAIRFRRCRTTAGRRSLLGSRAVRGVGRRRTNVPFAHWRAAASKLGPGTAGLGRLSVTASWETPPTSVRIWRFVLRRDAGFAFNRCNNCKGLPISLADSAGRFAHCVVC